MRRIVTTCDVGNPNAIISRGDFDGCDGWRTGEPKDAVLRAAWRPLAGGKHACPTCAASQPATALRAPKRDWSEAVREVYRYGQERTGRRWVLTGASEGARLVEARLAEGHPVEDCKHAIDHCYRAWHRDPKMQAFLVPTTIFRPSKFPKYLEGRME
jgi:uncharacterized phage protein (TIGR02220 family)